MRHYIIITKSGAPLANDQGTVILFASEAEAGRWLVAGDRIVPASADLAGLPAIEEDGGA